MRPITTFALSLSLLASHALADTGTLPKSMLEKMLGQNMAEQCSNQAYLNCMQQSASECQAFSRQYMSDCFAQVPDPVPLDDPALAQMMERCALKLAADMGIDADKADLCDEAMGEAEMPDPVWSEEAAPEEVEAMLQAELLQRQQEMLAAIDRMREASGSGSRLDEITLPLYEPYELGVHMADGAVWGEEQGLPTVTFKLNASKDQVLAFYQQKLPDFKIEPHDPYMLVERVLPGEQSMSKYLQVPHVAIYGIDETFVQITYRR